MSVQLVLTGDINIRLDRPDDPHTLRFNDILTLFGLVQHVQAPTYNSGEILDIVVTKTDSLSQNVCVKDVGLIDHCLVQWTRDLEMTPLEYETFMRRPWRRLDKVGFKNALEKSKLCETEFLNGATDVTELVELYNAVMKELLDQFAPPEEITSRSDPLKPMV